MLGEKLSYYIRNVRENVVPKDIDHVAVIEGAERSGKSSLAIQLCKEFDNDFTLENIAWDTATLKKLVYSLPKHSAILADEGVSMFFSRDAMKGENRDAVRLLTIMGERNNLLVICVTRLDMIDRYITGGRVNTLLKIIKRGRYKFYSPKKVKQIRYNNHLRKWSYPSANYAESYTMPDDKELWKEYKKLKVAFNTDQMNPEDDNLLKPVEAAKYADRHLQTIYQWVRKGLIRPVKKRGRNYYNKEDIDKIIAEI